MIFKIFNELRILLYLTKCRAPLKVYLYYIYNKIINKNEKKIIQSYNFNKKIFKSKKFTTDWFSEYTYHWLNIFLRYVDINKKFNILEIGSFEGRSTLFFLNLFKNSTITSVDTFKGSDEHNNMQINKIESNFDYNVNNYKNRLIKFKGTSKKFFSFNKVKKYNIVYIDGSHKFDDVYFDACKAYKNMAIGGIIIFDDYLWNYYKNYKKNPCCAINVFLKRNKHKLLSVYHQVIIQKI
jgi:predicted O-methyltransferase YrrM